MGKPDTFIENCEPFTNYKERLDAYLIANNHPPEKKTAILLSSIGAKPYGILRSLTAPDLPITKTYDELCKLLNDYYCPPPLEIMERFKFHNRKQESSESITEFVAAIKCLSEHCNFGTALQLSLMDRLVCGLKEITIQRRLLQEPKLTFETALNIATSMEADNRDAEEIQHNQSQAIHAVQANKKVDRFTMIKVIHRNRLVIQNKKHQNQCPKKFNVSPVECLTILGANAFYEMLHVILM